MAKLNLPASICSLQDVQGVEFELQTYGRWHAHNATKQQLGVQALDTVPPLTNASRNLLAQHRDVDSLLTELKLLAESAQTVSITLAAPPSGGLRQAIVAWCRQQIAPDTLVNFDFNSTLLGGMVVRHGSHIYDWSFRRQILAAQSKFPEVLRNVR